MEEPATITLNLRFYKSEGSEPPTHHIKVCLDSYRSIHWLY